MQYSYCNNSFSTNIGALLVSNRLVYCYYGQIGLGRSAIQIERVFGESSDLQNFTHFPFTVNSPGSLAHGCINSFKMQMIVGSPPT